MQTQTAPAVQATQAETQTVDVVGHQEHMSSIVMLRPQSPAGKAWMDENLVDAIVDDGWTFVDSRCIDDIVEGMWDAGLTTGPA